jgi:hypothetical protein
LPKKYVGLVLSALCAITIGVALLGAAPATQAQTATTLPAVPAGLKSSFTLGVSNGPGKTGWMTGTGAAWDVRYQYLAGGVNTTGNWKTWQWDQLPPGQFALDYMNESAKSGYMPVLTWYQLLQSSPASGANEVDKDYNNLNNSSTMKAYFADFKLLMDKAKTFGKPVIIHIEPDFWGFMQMRNANPNNLSASVAGSGYADVAAYPNTVAGFAKALVGLRNKYAPNALLAYHISPWSSSYGDLGSNHDPNFNVNGAAQQTGNFYKQMGANFDLMFYDIADRDAALYQSWGDPNRWWDVNNNTYPNFNRFNQFALAVTTTTGKRGMLWQVPVGNTLYRSMNNTTHHWQDNRVQYYLGNDNRHLQDLANSGLIGILFGAGDGNSTTYDDAAKDGNTNPAPINGNNLTAAYSDDDGGHLRLQAKAYYSRGALALPQTSAPVQPVPTATTTPKPTVAPTATAKPVIPANWQLSVSLSGSLTAGSTLTIPATFTAPSGASGNYIMDTEIYDLNTGAKVAQWYSTQSFTAGQVRTFTSNWQAKAGRYQVYTGLFDPNWKTLAWLQNGPAFQVN